MRREAKRLEVTEEQAVGGRSDFPAPLVTDTIEAMVTRRELWPVAAGAVFQPVARKGRLKQAVARWCFKMWSLEELAQNCVRLGIKGIDLIGPEEWPVAQKLGLAPSMAPGGGSIGDGLNRKENHSKIEQQMWENIEKAAAAGVPT